ncbi:MAG: MucBP domain-containing protein, partial [Lachnospiraceae bacterium]|nr:MucBP domain-containing protein [Lachnospiraceae bacterium]
MVRKKLRKLMAIAVAASICSPSCSYLTLPTLAKASTANAEQTTDNEKVFKVELDETGKITSDNSTSLEMQRFSWDNATVYFVLTDRFLNGDKSNDHSYGRGLQEDGKTAVAGLDTYSNPGTFHGGDLKGITSKVEEGYFNDLGVNAIWITAPYEQIHGYTSGNIQSNNCNTYPDSAGGGFPYYSYHGYWTLDYTNIDENMGNEDDFEKFVDTCHEHGIRVVMDVVMNHVGYTTMQDAIDYGFDGVLKNSDMATWKEYYYGNSTYLMGGDPEAANFWDSESSIWASKWWGAGFVKASYPGYTAAGGGDTGMSLCGLPDVHTESSAKEVPTPPLLVTKWTKEGRLSEEQGELDDYFSRTGNKKQARYYIIKWLTDWVREYGVDGFRCDTAKHVELDAWKDLKDEAVEALKEWRSKNSSKPGANWTDDFWMTGECWGHGMDKSPYHTSGGFDSMINFQFPKSGDPAGMEGTYSGYAAKINVDENYNTLSYLTSHDDSDTTMGVWKSDDAQNKNHGTCLLLAPGGVQIYYGNEMNRGLDWVNFFTGSDYLDQRFRSDMDWNGYSKDVLAHWQKVGSFRNKHLSVGGGQHEMLSEEPYTFARTYHLEEEDEDKVVCSVPGKAGTYTISVGDVFEDGETITDYYSGEKYEVSGGNVSVTCDDNGVILLEGSGIVKASVGAKSKIKTATYSADTFDVTLRANKAKDTYYSINGGEKVAYKADDVITLGGDTAYGEKTTLTLTGISEDDGSELTKEVTFERSKEPTVSDGVFCVKVKKSDFSTAPNIFVYTNDADETPLNGTWPGGAMTEDEDSEYWSFSSEEITGDACFILSLGATSNSGGTWRSTPDKAKGLVAEGSMLYDKTSGELEELPSGEPGKVTIKYVDQNGEELKSIYRVGVIGKKYTTYPAIIDGYTLTEEPENATGVFEAESEVVYVYSNGGAVTVTKQPENTPEPDDIGKNEDAGKNDDAGNNSDTDDTPGDNDNDNSLITPTPTVKPTKSTTPTSTPKPTVTNTPKPSSTPSTDTDVSEENKNNTTPTKKPTVTATPKPDVNDEDKNVNNDLKISSFTSNKKSPQTAGKTITFTAAAGNGSGNYQY